jgi:hypothetical protein
MSEFRLSKIQIASIVGAEDAPADERQIRIYMQDIRKGRGLKMPVLMRVAPDEFRTVDSDGRNKIEAARRCGAKRVAAYVIDEQPPEALERLRRGLKELRPSN